MKSLRILLFSVIIMLFVCFCSSAFADTGKRAFRADGVLYGDVNSDGKVSTDDVVVILKYCTGIVPLYSEQFVRGDVNCDGKLNTQDAGLVLRYSAGMLTELPYGVPSAEYVNEFSFVNYTFPGNDERVSLKKSRELSGIVLSRHPLLSVSVKVTDVKSGKTEIFESVFFDEDNNVIKYSTVSAGNSLDDKVHFSELSAGEKQLLVICSNTNSQNEIVYESTFRSGYTIEEIEQYCYNMSGEQSERTARIILPLLNSLNYNYDDGALVIAEGTKHLGEPYDRMNCSQFVKYVLHDAIYAEIPFISANQAIFCEENGYLVDYEDKKAGDLFFMSRTYCDCGRYHEIHHVALYIGTYDGYDYILESTSTFGFVVMRRVWGLSNGSWRVDCIAHVY